MVGDGCQWTRQESGLILEVFHTIAKGDDLDEQTNVKSRQEKQQHVLVFVIAERDLFELAIGQRLVL